MNCSVVIPTYKRPKVLLECISSLVAQVQQPDEVVIVDDDSLDSETVKKIEDTLSPATFIYHKKNHQAEARGSATSRNIGINKASHEIVFIFDDDLVLDPHFISSTMAVWETNQDPQLFAVGGVISNNRIPSKMEKICHRLGGLGNLNQWDINTIGFQSWNDGITENTIGHYAHGGVCSYKRKIVQKLGGFATFQGGRTALEDVEFFFKAKVHSYTTMVVASAKARHDHSPLGRENKYLSGYKEGFNRVKIYKIYTPNNILNKIWFIWATIAWTLRKLLSLQFQSAWGMIAGTLAANYKIRH